MAYYIVHRKNPYFKNGAIIELFVEGFQECIMEVKDNVQRCVGNKGLIMPEMDVFPYCILMLKRGFDDPKLRRKSGAHSINPDKDFDLDEAMAGL